ncbi:MAG: sugar ABC transporter permease [Spirochaetales bacterium]|nr:sugar ABC transporter permease [Spirochaetales bacterium]
MRLGKPSDSVYWRKRVLPYLLVFPSTALVVGILGYAILVALKDSLHRYPMLGTEGPFVGLDNYISLFQTPHFQSSVVNTFIFVFGTVLLGLLLSFVLALALFNLSTRARFFRTITLVPYLISGVAAAVIWRFLFNSDAGFINLILMSAGLDPVQWLSKGSNALLVVTLANTWKIFPMSTLLLLAGLQIIDSDIYDASIVDGASSRQVFLHITLPLLSNYLATSLIWLTFASFNMFAIIYPLTGGGPVRATEVMALYMYRLAFGELNFSAASAVMVMLLGLNILFSLVFIKTFRNRTG